MRSINHTESHVIYARGPLVEGPGPWSRLPEDRTFSMDGYIEQDCSLICGQVMVEVSRHPIPQNPLDLPAPWLFPGLLLGSGTREPRLELPSTPGCMRDVG